MATNAQTHTHNQAELMVASSCATITDKPHSCTFCTHLFGLYRVQESAGSGADLPKAEQWQSVAGRGLSCLVESKRILIGNRAWMTDNHVSISDEAEQSAAVLEDTGKTVDTYTSHAMDVSWVRVFEVYPFFFFFFAL